MQLFTKVFSIFVLLHAHSRAQSTKEKSSSVEWAYRGKNVTFDPELANNPNTFFFAACDYSGLPKTLNCDFVLENLEPADGQARSKTCSMNLVATKNRNLTRSLPKLAQFEQQSVFFSWEEESEPDVLHTMYKVLFVPRCVTRLSGEITEDFRLPSDKRKFVPVLYRNGYDVVIRDEKRLTQLAGYEVSRVSVFRNSRLLGQISPFPSEPEAERVVPVDFHSPSGGFFVASRESEELGFAHVTENGTYRTHLASLSTGNVRYAFSLAGRRVGFCWSSDSLVHRCRQFDKGGAELLNANVHSEKASSVLLVHNLDRGGVLLVTGVSCVVALDASTCERLEGFVVHEDGRSEERIDVPAPEFECDNYRPRYFTVLDVHESGGRFCFYFAKACAKLRDSLFTIKFSNVCHQTKFYSDF